MERGKRIFTLTEIKITDQDLEEGRFEVLKTGEYYDPRYDKFSVDEKLLSALKKNFDDGVLGIDIALDLNHDFNGAALAWIKSLEIEGGSLYATFKDFTEEAKRFFKEKVYKYFSVEFRPFEKVENGEVKRIDDVLRGIALTNRPVIKGMQPTFLSEGMAAEYNSLNNNDMNVIKKFAENLLKREKVTNEDLEALKGMTADLSEEEAAEVAEDVTKVEAKAEETVKAEAEAEEAAKKAEEEAADADEAEEGGEKKELADLREQNDARDKRLAELEAKDAERTLSDRVQGLILSEKNTVGFTSESTEDVKSFVKTLSDAQFSEFSKIIGQVRSIDAKFLSEVGSGNAGTSEESDTEAKAKKLAEEKMAANSELKLHEALEQAYSELNAPKTE